MRSLVVDEKGCDASVLIDAPSSERTALPNLGLRGFAVIDDAKAELEKACPNTVSCADILALAACGGSSWDVPLGRRDGRISSASEVFALPSPADSVAVQRRKFAAKGLDHFDLVTLVGAHTIGKTACQFFRYRLYNFTSGTGPDPTINETMLEQLKSVCPENSDGRERVGLDSGAELEFDASFYHNVREGKDVLESDQRLWEDRATHTMVNMYARDATGSHKFRKNFEEAIVRMGSIEVKTGVQGEIRRICSKINY
ncbi:peroxidase 25-like [Andrographis paniculata]|uniref:peroxidase 25-like n=1 Tax=Andrographis paniculata TaxID=175694 RepID=UPI0021E7C480|nr:peroxidase 25-like [Andrographis paniculata]